MSNSHTHIDSPLLIPLSWASQVSNFGYALDELAHELSSVNWLPSNPIYIFSRIHSLACELKPADRLTWLSGLHQIWESQGNVLAVSECKILMSIAAIWCDWPLVMAIGIHLYTQGNLDKISGLSLLDALQKFGRVGDAIEVCVNLQLIFHDLPEFNYAFQRLSAWQQWHLALHNIQGSEWGDPSLLLEPLGHHHLEDFSWQYHDTSIASRCCLPQFQYNYQWHQWLNSIYQYADQEIFAVLHTEWGFIGSVSLIRHGGIGFFYYWLGPDFQGHGFGPRAVALLLASAQERYGLHTCYAKVFDYNEPSRKALLKLGFEDIQVRAIAPDDNEMFYRRGPAVDRATLAEELHWLMSAMDSSARPAILLQAH